MRNAPGTFILCGLVLWRIPQPAGRRTKRKLMNSGNHDHPVNQRIRWKGYTALIAKAR
jgi:hypothetical protein